jgi:hypothetical protein
MALEIQSLGKQVICVFKSSLNKKSDSALLTEERRLITTPRPPKSYRFRSRDVSLLCFFVLWQRLHDLHPAGLRHKTVPVRSCSL